MRRRALVPWADVGASAAALLQLLLPIYVVPGPVPVFFDEADWAVVSSPREVMAAVFSYYREDVPAGIVVDPELARRVTSILAASETYYRGPPQWAAEDHCPEGVAMKFVGWSRSVEVWLDFDSDEIGVRGLHVWRWGRYKMASPARGQLLALAQELFPHQRISPDVVVRPMRR
jgi:hypothetical protein